MSLQHNCIKCTHYREHWSHRKQYRAHIARKTSKDLLWVTYVKSTQLITERKTEQLQHLKWLAVRLKSDTNTETLHSASHLCEGVEGVVKRECILVCVVLLLSADFDELMSVEQHMNQPEHDTHPAWWLQHHAQTITSCSSQQNCQTRPIARGRWQDQALDAKSEVKSKGKMLKYKIKLYTVKNHTKLSF